MASKVIKENRVRELFGEIQVTADAITYIDEWVLRNLKVFVEELSQSRRIDADDIDLFINTKLINSIPWSIARENFMKRQIETYSDDEF